MTGKPKVLKSTTQTVGILLHQKQTKKGHDIICRYLYQYIFPILKVVKSLEKLQPFIVYFLSGFRCKYSHKPL